MKNNVKELALRACEMLVQAYKNGEESEHIDWNDVDQAHTQARLALRAEKREKKHGR